MNRGLAGLEAAAGTIRRLLLVQVGVGVFIERRFGDGDERHGALERRG